MTAIPYKNTRTPRVINEQTGFQKGSYFTNQEVPANFAKLLVNYDYTDDGQILKPRQGITNDRILRFNDDNAESTGIVNLGTSNLADLVYFKDLAGNDSLIESIISFGEVQYFGGTGTTEAIGEVPGVAFTIPENYYYAPNVKDVQTVVNANGTVVSSRIGESGWNIVLDKRNAPSFIQNPYSLGHFKHEITTDSVGLIKTKNYTNLDLFNIGTESFKVHKPIFTLYSGALYAICTSYIEKDTQNVNTEGTSVITNTYKCADPVFRLSQLVIEEETYVGEDVTYSDFNIKRKPVVVKKPTVAEAAVVGYNILLDEPYEFPNVAGSTMIHGVIPYAPLNDSNGNPITADPLGKLLFSANTGEVLRLNLVYSFETGATYKIKWEYKGESAEDWKLLKDFTAVTVGVNSLIYYDLLPTDNSFSVQVTLRKNDDATTDRLGYLPNYILNQDDLKNLNNVTFNLNTAKGMFTHNNMLGLYGVEKAETALFFSDIDNPGYFPFPHNMHSFNEQILKVENYLDSLIVITTNSVYAITGKGLPSSFVVKQIITNLNITELDADQIKVIKDQVFFKADNTYFVMRPNAYTGDATDLRLFEVSKSINTFLQGFKVNTLELYNKLYPIRLTDTDITTKDRMFNNYLYNDLKIIGYSQQVLDGRLQVSIRLEISHNPDTQDPLSKRVVNQSSLVLVYDTITRQWYLQIYSLLDVGSVRHRRIDNQSLLMFDNMKRNGHNYIIVAKATQEARDYYYVESLEGDEEPFSFTPKIKNWQMLDTGIVQLNNSLFKRLRELQFTVNNLAQDKLKFYTQVYCDGKNVVDSTTFHLEHITDPEDANYGQIYVDAEDVSNLEVTGSTALDAWELDFSMFPDITLVRANLKITGRGRFVSATIINRDELKYEVSNTFWVYRPMSAR